MTTSSLRAKATVPNVDSYTVPSTTPEDVELFIEEDEDYSSNNSSIIQTGWASVKEASIKNSKYATDFKFDEDLQLVKFISSEPISFMQHWVNRPGKKSFVSIGEDDPLIAVGSVPSRKFAFTVLNLSDPEGPQLELMTVGIRLCKQIEKLASDPKTGPLNRSDMYFAVSKSGTGTKTTHTIVPVKERDLADDWDIDPVATADYVKTLKAYTADAIYMSSRQELSEVAREIAAAGN
jgi:hypothetical protein